MDTPAKKDPATPRRPSLAVVILACAALLNLVWVIAAAWYVVRLALHWLPGVG